MIDLPTPLPDSHEQILELSQIQYFECMADLRIDLLRSEKGKVETESFTKSDKFGYIYRLRASENRLADYNVTVSGVRIIWSLDGVTCQIGYLSDFDVGKT